MTLLNWHNANIHVFVFIQL